MFLFQCLEPIGVQLPNLRGRDAKDLAQCRIGYILYVFSRGHKSPELELDQIVDLLFSELLHHLNQEIKMANGKIAVMVQILRDFEFFVIDILVDCMIDSATVYRMLTTT